MECETFLIFKSFQRVLYCTPNLFKYFKLDQNTPSIFRFFSLHWASPLKMAQSQNREYESEKNDTKTGIMQVLIELQQKIFHHQLAPN